jgi:hypothetical protein
MITEESSAFAVQKEIAQEISERIAEEVIIFRL